jgi:hypothetical protein
MAITYTPRFSLARWSTDDDELTRVQFDGTHASLDATAAKFLVGTGNPPTGAAEYVGAFFYNTSTLSLWFYTGSVTALGVFTAGSWVKINQIDKSRTDTAATGGPGVYYNATGSGGGAITYGTAAPSGTANEGDIYLRYLA